mgnify:FL=1
MIKTTIFGVRSAFLAFTRIFEETKLDQKATWRVSRLLGQLKQHVKDYERAMQKLYKDAGGIVDGRGISMDVLLPLQDGEELSDYEKRRDLYREKANGLSEALEALNDNEVEVNYDAIPLSILPKERKNDKGEKEPIEYRATAFANAGPFIVDDSEKKE